MALLLASGSVARSPDRDLLEQLVGHPAARYRLQPLSARGTARQRFPGAGEDLCTRAGPRCSAPRRFWEMVRR